MGRGREASWEEAVTSVALERGALPPPAELTPLACKGCGGPLSPATLGCAYCQAEASFDLSVRATMRRRAGQVQRHARKLQSTMRYHLRSVVAPRSRWLIRLAGPLDVAAAILLYLAAVALPFLALGLTWSGLMAAGFSKSVRAPAAFVAFFVATVPGILMHGWYADRLFGSFARGALRVLALELHGLVASCELHVRLTQTSRCGSCGAFFSSAVVAEQTTVECPYCRAPLVLTGQSVQRAADEALGAAQREAQVAMPGSFAERLEAFDSNPALMQMIDYRRVGGLYQSADGRVSVHHRDQPPNRIDIDLDNALPGRVVLLRPPNKGAFDGVLAELGELPPHVVERERPMIAYLDPDVSAEVLDLPEVQRLVPKILPGEAVLFDGAGGTFLQECYDKYVDKLTGRVVPRLRSALERLGSGVVPLPSREAGRPAANEGM